MSYENTAGLGVNNHYGPRNTSGVAAGAQGNDVYRTASYTVEDGLVIAGVVPANAIITNYHEFDLTGTATAVTVGGANVKLADGTKANQVVSATGGAITVTGTMSAGKIMVEFITVGDSAVQP